MEQEWYTYKNILDDMNNNILNGMYESPLYLEKSLSEYMEVLDEDEENEELLNKYDLVEEKNKVGGYFIFSIVEDSIKKEIKIEYIYKNNISCQVINVE